MSSSLLSSSISARQALSFQAVLCGLCENSVLTAVFPAGILTLYSTTPRRLSVNSQRVNLSVGVEGSVWRLR